MTPEQEPKSSVAIVCVDDDRHALYALGYALRRATSDLRLFENPEDCLRELGNKAADILIVDLDMPGLTGLDLLKEAKRRWPDIEVIIATGHADTTNAIQALKAGAFDFFEKPVHPDELLASVARTVRYRTVLQERNRCREQIAHLVGRETRRFGLDAFVGASPAIRRVLDDIVALQSSDRTSVLITGESGTGKELVARAIHAGSARANRPFVAINCSAIPETLAESVLFGHLKGSFTGASVDRRGSFELADGGVLFLDEIGDMAPLIQAKLLRVLEDGMVEPVGATSPRKVDTRIIAATNADLDSRVAESRFRQDLFHRLARFRVRLPPLRERKEDVPLLAQHFVNVLCEEMGLPPRSLPRDVLDRLQAYDYPGNVRELRNLVEQALIRSAGSPLRPEHVLLPAPLMARQAQSDASPPSSPRDGGWGQLPLNLKELQRLALREAMVRSRGNVSAAARLLGIGRSTLYRELGQV